MRRTRVTCKHDVTSSRTQNSKVNTKQSPLACAHRVHRPHYPDVYPEYAPARVQSMRPCGVMTHALLDALFSSYIVR